MERVLAGGRPLEGCISDSRLQRRRLCATTAARVGACCPTAALAGLRGRWAGGAVPYLHVHAVRVGALDLHASHLIAYTLAPAGHSRRRRAAACVRRGTTPVVRSSPGCAEFRRGASVCVR